MGQARRRGVSAQNVMSYSKPKHEFVLSTRRERTDDEKSVLNDARAAAGAAIKAMDPTASTSKWEYPLAFPSWAGILSTAGGIVFSAPGDGDAIALDDTTGKLLWKFHWRPAVRQSREASPSEGKQQIATSIGHAAYAF